MKILYLNFDRGIPVLGDKGASVHVREFVRAAADLGHEVVVICARLGAGNAQPPGIIIEVAPLQSVESTRMLAEELGVDTAGLDAALVASELSKLLYDQSAADRVMDVLQEQAFHPDFIYERHALFSSAGTDIAGRFGCPRILEVNAPLAEEQKRFRGLRLESIARRMEAASFGTAESIIAVSEAVGEYVKTLLAQGEERVQVVPNGVDLQRFSAGALRRDEIRHRLGVNSETCIIGFVGSFKSWHGTDFLFDIYRSIAATRDVHLLAVGDGPRWGELYGKVASSSCRDTVTLTGRVPHADIPSWTAACDVVVAPYHATTDFYFSPLKVVEALACGRPVVAPRIGQLVELITDGETGLLYRPDDAHDCARVIVNLLDDSQRRLSMGAAAQASVSERGWDRIVQRVTDLALAARVGEAA